MIAYAATGEEVAGETASELARLIQLVITKIPLWIAAVIVIFLTVIVAKIARKVVENKLAEKGVEEEHKELQILGGRMTYVIILTLGITVGLKIAGIDLTTIIAAVAFGIGFALKDLIMNFLAGVMILVGRHFTIGDFIKVGKTLGKVVEIQARVTVMQAIDGTKVVVPNADLLKKQVVSYTSNPFRRIEIIVGVDYRTDLENAVKVSMETIKDTKNVLSHPKPAVLIDDFAESSVNLKIRAWVEARGWLKVKSNLVKNIKEAFDQYGIVIPWPIRTVAYDKDIERAEKMIEEDKKQEKQQQAAQPQIQQFQTIPAPNQAQAPAPQNANDEDQPLKPLNEQR